MDGERCAAVPRSPSSPAAAYQLEQYGLGGWRRSAPRPFALFLLPEPGRWGLFRFAMRLAWRSAEAGRDYDVFTGRSIDIETKARRRLVARDGERERMASPFRLRMREEPLTVIAPGSATDATDPAHLGPALRTRPAGTAAPADRHDQPARPRPRGHLGRLHAARAAGPVPRRPRLPVEAGASLGRGAGQPRHAARQPLRAVPRPLEALQALHPPRAAAGLARPGGGADRRQHRQPLVVAAGPDRRQHPAPHLPLRWVRNIPAPGSRCCTTRWSMARTWRSA